MGLHLEPILLLVDRPNVGYSLYKTLTNHPSRYDSYAVWFIMNYSFASRRLGALKLFR